MRKVAIARELADSGETVAEVTQVLTVSRATVGLAAPGGLKEQRGQAVIIGISRAALCRHIDVVALREGAEANRRGGETH
jgi:hypothetical protein